MPGCGGCAGGSFRERAGTVLTLWQASFIPLISQVTCLLEVRASPYLGYAQQHLPLLVLLFLDKLHPLIHGPVRRVCYASQIIILDVYKDLSLQLFVPCGTRITVPVRGVRTTPSRR